MYEERGPARPEIAESWRRVNRLRVDPDDGPDPHHLPIEEVQHRRETSPLAGVLPELYEGLKSVSDEPGHVLVVSDAEGVVLWRSGGRRGLRAAEAIGLQQGAHCGEEVIGTNGIGTVLVARTPLAVRAREHSLRIHKSWTCIGAPLHDPRDGRLLGVADLSGPAETLPPTALPLITAVTRLAEASMRERHRQVLDRLRSVAAPVLAGLRGQAFAVDAHGWVAGAVGLAPPDRVRLPLRPEAGECTVPGVGRCVMEPLPGGWLLRVGKDEEDQAPSQVVLDVSSRNAWTLTVEGYAGRWAQELSPRHAEVLLLLALRRDGLSAASLADGLFGDATRTVTVRAEMSRLRRTLSSVLTHRPYRFTDGVDVQVRFPERLADLLPHSTAPGVRAARSG
ncbi:GAF domain-containing protein [Streptomyces sp. A7024]|uniref:GAF domain-containing protein n=1 Tax=Streptomyces coryli TaxID=1128680 RepID=A0A6G4UES8_9ACTN|nr:helix-turn-helix domain-containing protein [Streptomyces coryli]NGN69991.1 GAF domain-containing protein [Streptomyces coryli]